MHIALCTDGIHPLTLGGMQRHSRLLAEHLARSGAVELTVLHPHAEQVFDPALGIREVRVAPMDNDALYLRQLWRYSGRVGEQLKALRPDVILSQGFCVWQGVQRFSSRLVMHPHGLEMFQGITGRERLMGVPFRALVRNVARRSAAVVSLGGRLTPILEHAVAGSACRVVPVPNAVEMPAPPAAMPGSGSAPVVLLFAGRFAFNKGIDVLMEVARRLVREGRQGLVRFDLVGDGPLFAQYRNSALPANVRLLGRLDDEALARSYATCDAFVLPTRFEGMPTVVLEAMAHAKPVLVSDVGATAELVDRRNGRLMPPGDVDALHAAVLELALMPAEGRAAMGREGRDKVLREFTWPVVAQRFIRLFREVMP